MKKIEIGIVDDHQLFTKSLCLMIDSFTQFEVVVDASNGKKLQEKLGGKIAVPEIMLIDVNMPIMDGMATTLWLFREYPAMKLVALSMNESDKAIIGMLKAGCCAYLSKEIHPIDLEKALTEIHLRGYYNADAGNINFRRLLMAEKKELNISDKEKIFLQLACSDKTYKLIAAEMGLSERTIDGYRESLFSKMHVQSRVGLALEAIRMGLVEI